MGLSTKIFESVSNENKKTKLIEEAEDYSNTVPKNILNKIEEMLLSAGSGTKWKIDNVYRDLGIFDWWPEYLTIGHLKQMKSFLRNAINLGFDKYACFKVGAHGCANGMWASDAPTTDGYSPKDCKTLYRSFTPDYTYYDVDLGNGFTKEEFKTIAAVKSFIAQETGEAEALENTKTEKVETPTESLDSEEIKANVISKTVSEAISYLNELTGLKFNTTKLNAKQVKIMSSTDNYLVATLDKDNITNISDINIKK